jgi:Ran-binding protein 3
MEVPTANENKLEVNKSSDEGRTDVHKTSTVDQKDVNESELKHKENVLADTKKNNYEAIKVENIRGSDEKKSSIPAVKDELSVSDLPASSGFANASSVSPFGSLQGTQEPTTQSQSSASSFAASGFAKLSASTQSPFGTLGGTTAAASPFAAVPKGAAPAFGGPLSSKPLFTAAAGRTLNSSGQSPFANVNSNAAVSSFGGLSNAANASPFGGLPKAGATAFSTPGAAGIQGLSSKPARPFGAAAVADEDEEASDAEGEENEAAQAAEDKPDNRFWERNLATGEENENCRFMAHAKLYIFSRPTPDVKGEWKERGVGTLKLNVEVPPDDVDQAPPKARLLMRANGSHRVVLNAPIMKEVKYGDANGKKPENGTVIFRGVDEGNMATMCLKMKAPLAIELYNDILAMQREMVRETRSHDNHPAAAT